MKTIKLAISIILVVALSACDFVRAVRGPKLALDSKSAPNTEPPQAEEEEEDDSDSEDPPAASATGSDEKSQLIIKWGAKDEGAQSDGSYIECGSTTEVSNRSVLRTMVGNRARAGLLRKHCADINKDDATFMISSGYTQGMDVEYSDTGGNSICSRAAKSGVLACS